MHKYTRRALAKELNFTRALEMYHSIPLNDDRKTQVLGIIRTIFSSFLKSEDPIIKLTMLDYLPNIIRINPVMAKKLLEDALYIETDKKLKEEFKWYLKVVDEILANRR